MSFCYFSYVNINIIRDIKKSGCNYFQIIFVKQTEGAIYNIDNKSYKYMNYNRPSSYKKLSYTQKLANYNQRKRHGDVVKIAWETDYSETHVSDVLNGKYENTRIMNKAYDNARGRKVNVAMF
jgi:hypothetical protein